MRVVFVDPRGHIGTLEEARLDATTADAPNGVLYP